MNRTVEDREGEREPPVRRLMYIQFPLLCKIEACISCKIEACINTCLQLTPLSYHCHPRQLEPFFDGSNRGTSPTRKRPPPKTPLRLQA